MMLSMRVTPIVLLGLLAHAPDARADVQFASALGDREDVYVWPLNAHAGYAFTTGNGGGAGVAIGLDLATVTYKALVVDALTMRMSLRPSGGDVFLGTRVAAALYPGKTRAHQLSLGLGFGWGAFEADTEKARDGGLVIAPSVRYAYRGVAGLEVAVHVPMYDGTEGRRPTMISVNVIGLGLGLVALAGIH